MTSSAPYVAFVIPGLDRIGGAERQVMSLAKGLRRRDWRVSVVALSGTGEAAPAELAAVGIGFLRLKMCKGLADPRGWIGFDRWLRRERPHVVHAHLPHAAWFARWSRLGTPLRKLPAPVFIDTLHTSSTGSLGRQLGYGLSKWLPDMVTAVSQAVADAHLAAHLVNPNKFAIVPNGVDLGALKPDALVRLTARSKLGVADGFVWLAAGRLEAVKDYPTLIQAMSLLPGTARLLIAGNGPLLSELRSLSAQLGLERRVRFLGFDPEVKLWMNAADGFVQSSLWEGLPLGLLEAGACTLPAVATDVPGSREVIVHGQTGWLAPPGNPAVLAQTMAAVMRAAPQERRTMGQMARQHVTEQFSLEAVLDKWEALYCQLVSTSNPTAQKLNRAL